MLLEVNPCYATMKRLPITVHMVSSFLAEGGRPDHGAGAGQPSPSNGLVFASCGREAASRVSLQPEILFRES